MDSSIAATFSSADEGKGLVRATFAHGVGKPSADVLCRALDSGVGWEAALEGAAQGLGEWYGWPAAPAAVVAPVRHRRSGWRMLALGSVVLGVGAGVVLFAS